MGYVVNKEMETLLASFEFEEYGHNRLVSFTCTEENFELRFLVAILQGSRQEQHWKITATGILDSLLHLGDSEITFSDDHPILHRYTQPSARLSIRGTPEDPLKLLAALPNVRHVYGLHSINLDVLIAGYGIVAEGPLPWVEKVDELLKQHQVATTLLVGTRQSRKKPLALLMSRGFVVAEKMTAEKLP